MTLELTPVDGIGEVETGADLAQLVLEHTTLRDLDVVVVTSKVVSKALGLTTTRSREELVVEGTDRVVAQRGGTRIVRTRHGLTMAAAGVDASNVGAGTAIPLPPDPDGEARRLRSALRDATGLQVAVVVSDTAGRAWRTGQTDIAIGCAGLLPLESFAGRADTHGNTLAVTAPAVADEVAGAAELASGKLGGRPVVVVRGLPAHLHIDDDGPGATALVRPEDEDLFGLGAREAVLAAVAGGSPRGFPLPADEVSAATVVDLVDDDGLDVEVRSTTAVVRAPSDRLVDAGRLAERLRVVAFAHRVDLVVEIVRAG